MKHLHMLMAFTTIALFLWQSYQVAIAQRPIAKRTKIATHIIYTLLIISGIVTVMPLIEAHVPLQWLLGKIILLVAAISASIKAFKPQATLSQRKAGIFIALIAYIGILLLAFLKPMGFI